MSTVLNTAAKVKAEFGGTTWTQISGRFLLAANSSYAVKATGGSANAIVPYHRHSVAAVSIASSGSNTTTYAQRSDSGSSSGWCFSPVSGKYITNNWGGNSNHTHSVPAHNTDYAGTSGNTTGANMPPYYVVYIWERTA